MSQGAVRATKREIRRALGPAALASIDRIAQTGEGLAHIVAKHDKWIASLQLEYDIAADETFSASDRLLRHQIHAFVHRPFWGRLRWLVLGR